MVDSVKVPNRTFHSTIEEEILIPILYCDWCWFLFQTSQVSLELEEKTAKVSELEDFLTMKNKEVKQLQEKLTEMVGVLWYHIFVLIMSVFFSVIFNWHENIQVLLCLFLENYSMLSDM